MDGTYLRNLPLFFIVMLLSFLFHVLSILTMMRKIRNRNSEKITVIRSVLRETLYAMDFPEISAIIKTSIVYCKADPPLFPDSKKEEWP